MKRAPSGGRKEGGNCVVQRLRGRGQIGWRWRWRWSESWTSVRDTVNGDCGWRLTVRSETVRDRNTVAELYGEQSALIRTSHTFRSVTSPPPSPPSLSVSPSHSQIHFLRSSPPFHRPPYKYTLHTLRLPGSCMSALPAVCPSLSLSFSFSFSLAPTQAGRDRLGSGPCRAGPPHT